MKKPEIIIATIAALVVATVGALAGIGTVSIPLTETQVLPASAYRKWVVLQNNTTNDVYVKWDSATNALTTTNGVKLAANGGTLTITATATANPARNAIKAISLAGTNSIRYQEGNEQ